MDVTNFFLKQEILSKIKSFSSKNKIGLIKNWSDVYTDCYLVYIGAGSIIKEKDIINTRFFIANSPIKSIIKLPKEVTNWLGKDTLTPIIVVDIDLSYVSSQFAEYVTNYFSNKYRLIWLDVPV